MDVITVVVWIIGLLLLYLVIKLAIDGSETAENIREIRKILSTQFPESKISGKQEKDLYEILELPIDECPACHSKVSQNDKECPSCGLSLESVKE